MKALFICGFCSQHGVFVWGAYRFYHRGTARSFNGADCIQAGWRFCGDGGGDCGIPEVGAGVRKYTPRKRGKEFGRKVLKYYGHKNHEMAERKSMICIGRFNRFYMVIEEMTASCSIVEYVIFHSSLKRWHDFNF